MIYIVCNVGYDTDDKPAMAQALADKLGVGVELAQGGMRFEPASSLPAIDPADLPKAREK